MRVSGAEEGRRFIHKTVSKHSEMVESIRKLSDGLMALEAKLKVTQHKVHTHWYTLPLQAGRLSQKDTSLPCVLYVDDKSRD